MSIRERIDQIKAEGEEKVKSSLVSAETTNANLKRRKTAEFSQKLRERQKMFGELKEAGIVGIIEEFVGFKIKIGGVVTTIPLEIYKEIKEIEKGKVIKIYEDGHSRIGRETKKAREIREERFKELRESNWQVRISQPSLGEDGNWNDSLEIEIEEKYPINVRSRQEKGNSATLVYKNGNLKISGNETTFSGPIPSLGERMEVLENAFALAFYNPKKHPLPTPVFSPWNRPRIKSS